MRKHFLITIQIILISTISVSAKIKIDTVDFWHVFYNKKIISGYNELSSKPQIIVKIHDIKETDVLSVEYGDDTPDDDIKTGLYIKEDRVKNILANGKGTSNPLKISVSRIFAICKHFNKQHLDFYYFDKKHDRFIFQLKFVN
ncbi:MAG TPA: hypothetical protein VGI43_01150 [Mucilaginibacter sp.]